MGLLDELEWRGLVHQKTAEDLGAVLEQGPTALYCGFDPTGPSLHVGHLLPVVVLQHFLRAGHRTVALTGGATGLIGDPSGKSAERNLLTREQVAENARRIGGQLARLLDNPANPPVTADNIEWLDGLRLLDFLRDTGKHFSINAMVQKDSVRLRLEREGDGISFTEFTYSLLQAQDFYELHRRYGCVLQVGGSDQWGNIVGGVDLIRRMTGARAFGLTVPLLTDSAGNKFGKTEGGAVFLDAALTSPYAFYQFWVNVSDEDVARLLKLFTFLSRSEIDALAATVGSPQRDAQKALAYDLTARIHGRDEADKAVRESERAFTADLMKLPGSDLLQMTETLPSTAVTRSDVEAGKVSFAQVLVRLEATESLSKARDLFKQQAITASGGSAPIKVLGFDPKVELDNFVDGQVMVLQKGKRNKYLVKLEG